MTWFISKNKTSSFNILPKFQKGSDYITVWWGRRELVIYTGNKLVEETTDKDINFLPLPLDPNDWVLMSLREFVECGSSGLIAASDGVGYYADVRFMSDVAVDFDNLKSQASDFVRRKQEGKWYPTHVVWYERY